MDKNDALTFQHQPSTDNENMCSEFKISDSLFGKENWRNLKISYLFWEPYYTAYKPP